MAQIQFIHARFSKRAGTKAELVRHLQGHLLKLRTKRLTDSKTSSVTTDVIGVAASSHEDHLVRNASRQVQAELTYYDLSRIERRATRLHNARSISNGLNHLGPEDLKQLERLKNGVRLAQIQSEHRADEVAADLHADFPWLAAATEVVWHSMRRSVREGWPGLRLQPMLLDGPPGIGKSVWARRLGEVLDTPSMIIEATNENASFGIVGSQRGWSNAAPGRVLGTIFTSQVGNPIVIVDEVDKAGSATSSKGRSFDLAAALLPLLEPATARHWSCPYYEVGFDMSWIGWVLTSNNFRDLPTPLLSRCPPIRLSALSLEDLVGFALRESHRRGLSQASSEAIQETLLRLSPQTERLSLRTVIRMIEHAERLEAEQVRQ
ncbi:Lon protease [Antarctobacter heliothermus]|uniref:Lon protease n=1 Tax=Antarctobacter heliothermus TaxID=74033 RepID=A0A222E2E0_9RHOB|nr:AAA family ATPase [Antarctobacter heliothermus]ASP20384.1 Lon protease [Antarctobacter heliothermus]